jgi:hypothetical protein
MRAEGIGPITRWVDDRIFFRIPRAALAEFNAERAQLHADISRNGAQHHEGGRTWYHAGHLSDGRVVECDEDMAFPLKDLSQSSPRSAHDAQFTYCMSDIDRIAAPLGTPWERSKDIPFGTIVRYIGLDWDITQRTATLPDTKREKYRWAILEWNTSATHTLREVQSLHGKLLHACHVIPAGRAYLTRLENFMGNFRATPFQPRTPPKGTHADLDWWLARLTAPAVPHPIPGPIVLHDHSAFSDASSGMGLGIVVGEHWRAWRLIGDWHSQGRDIGWAEAVAFELLTSTLVTLYGPDFHFKCNGDNTGVVEGWWKGSSRNHQTNDVFRRIHEVTETTGARFHTRYVPSEHNPADAPSRGILGHPRRILPPVPLSPALLPYLCDATESTAWPAGPNPPLKRHTWHESRRHAFQGRQLEQRGEEVTAAAAACNDT